MFRLCWSAEVLDEVERALIRIHRHRGTGDAEDRARRARSAMERAFEDALVEGYVTGLDVGEPWPDTGDAHVVAAAVEARADIIVTENLKDFPKALLRRRRLDACSADDFLSDLIATNPDRAVAAIRRMRLRFGSPERSPADLLSIMQVDGLTRTSALLEGHQDLL